MSNSLDPDQAQHFVEPDLGTNCLQTPENLPVYSLHFWLSHRCLLNIDLTARKIFQSAISWKIYPECQALTSEMRYFVKMHISFLTKPLPTYITSIRFLSETNIENNLAATWENIPLTMCTLGSITKTRLFKYIDNFTAKNWKFSDKNSDIFHISAQNIDCGYSNEYPQSMFFSRNKKNNVSPQFLLYKSGI